jgi:hypothetical protein
VAGLPDGASMIALCSPWGILAMIIRKLTGTYIGKSLPLL